MNVKLSYMITYWIRFAYEYPHIWTEILLHLSSYAVYQLTEYWDSLEKVDSHHLDDDNMTVVNNNSYSQEQSTATILIIILRIVIILAIIII